MKEVLPISGKEYLPIRWNDTTSPKEGYCEGLEPAFDGERADPRPVPEHTGSLETAKEGDMVHLEGGPAQAQNPGPRQRSLELKTGSSRAKT
jgi:hypothetical protein